MIGKKFARQKSFTLYPVDEKALQEIARRYATNLSAAVRLAIEREYARLMMQDEMKKWRSDDERE